MNQVIIFTLGVLLCNTWWPNGPCSKPLPVLIMFGVIWIIDWVDNLPEIEE